MISGVTGRLQTLHLWGPLHWGVAECIDDVIGGLPSFPTWVELEPDAEWRDEDHLYTCVVLEGGEMRTGC